MSPAVAKAAACYDWLTPEAVTQHAAAALAMAQRYEQRFYAEEDGEPDTPEDPALARPSFASFVVHIFSTLINEQAVLAKLPGFHPDECLTRIRDYLAGAASDDLV